MALLEAMAVGLPVVATRVGGVPEIVQHTVSGLLVEPGSPVDLARAVAAVLQNPTLAATLGGCGRLRIEREASVARHVEGLAQVLTDVS